MSFTDGLLIGWVAGLFVMAIGMITVAWAWDRKQRTGKDRRHGTRQ